METTNDSRARCPVCGGPAKDVQFFADTDTGIEDGSVEPITIRACENTACDAYHPAARQNMRRQPDLYPAVPVTAVVYPSVTGAAS